MGKNTFVIKKNEILKSVGKNIWEEKNLSPSASPNSQWRLHQITSYNQ